MRATPSTPGTQRLTAGISIMNAHTRSGEAGTVIRFSITIAAYSIQTYTCAFLVASSVYIRHRHGCAVRSTLEGLPRRTAADRHRHHPARWQRADGAPVVRVPRRPDLAQWRTKPRLG